MLNQKGNSLVFILILVGFLALLLTTFNLKPPLPAHSSLQKTAELNQTQDPDDINEDELSMYQIPNDVLAALNQSNTEDSSVLGIKSDGPTYHIPILMYHYIEHVQNPQDKVRISLNILPETFDKQLETLIKAGYNFITASDLADILDGIKQPPPNPVMLTFDDGYRDFYTDAFPILKKYNVKAVNYVISGFLNQPNHLTDPQLKEIAQSGLVEIGAHTVHHVALRGRSTTQVETEVGQSKIQLEQKIGSAVTAFAYPYGSLDIHALRIVKESGFRTAVSTIPGSHVSNSVRYLTYRLRPGARTGQSLLNLISN